MSRTLTFVAFSLSLLLAAAGTHVLRLAHVASDVPAVYDPNPNHIWNRTYSCLFVRRAADGKVYGVDALDPPLWDKSQYLLVGGSHRRAVACLVEFLNSHAELAVQDPVKRAFLQHDLWTAFDWVARGDGWNFPKERRELESLLAEAIRRLALTPEQVALLPDTYEVAVESQAIAQLPSDLFHANSPWVCLSAYTDGATAAGHFSGRSRFLVFMKLPGGRDATVDYVEKLHSSGLSPLVGPDAYHRYLNLALPQFPAGTEVALVRQLIVIDNTGKLVPTRMIESVQLRLYHNITPGTRYMNDLSSPSRHDQDFFELRTSRAELFAGQAGGLVAVGSSQTEFPVLFSQGIDPLESNNGLDQAGVILNTCVHCHAGSGIHSVDSRLQWMKPESTPPPGDRYALETALSWEGRATVAQKKQQADFKLLQSLWKAKHMSAGPTVALMIRRGR